MTDPNEGWKDVETQLTKLAERLQNHFRELAQRGASTEPSADESAGPAEASAPEEPAAEAGERPGSPGEKTAEELKEAAREVARVMEEVVNTLGRAAQDPEVKESAAGAARSFMDVVGATFSQLGDELTKMTEKHRASDAAAAEDPPEDDTPPTDDDPQGA